MNNKKYLLPTIDDYIVDIYFRYLGAGNPGKSRIWFIGNEESGVSSSEQVRDKLLFDGLVDINFECQIDNGTAYKYDLTFDKRAGYSDTSDEFKGLESHFFTKELSYLYRITSSNLNSISGCIESSIYAKYVEFLNLINLNNISRKNHDLLDEIFLGEFYFLPSKKDDYFKKIYKVEKRKFYLKNKYLLEERILILKEILDDYYFQGKLIVFWGNDEIKKEVIQKLFGDFKSVGKVLTKYQEEEAMEEDVLFKEYNSSKLFIVPFINRIVDNSDLAKYFICT